MAHFLLKDMDDAVWNRIKKKTQQKDIHLKYLVPELLELWLKGNIKIDEKKLRKLHNETKTEGYARRVRPAKKKRDKENEA